MTRRSFRRNVTSPLFVRLNQQLNAIENHIEMLVEIERTPDRHFPKQNTREALQRYYSAYAATAKALDILEERT
jgi:hypothetical protein